MSKAEFTLQGLSRAAGLDPGPAQAVSAVYVMEPDGRRLAGSFIPDPEPASRGRAALIIICPPGGGTVRAVELNAADGVTIVRIHGPVILRDGDSLTIPLEVQA